MSKNEEERLKGLKKLYLAKLSSLKRKQNAENQIEAFKTQIDQINSILKQSA